MAGGAIHGKASGVKSWFKVVTFHSYVLSCLLKPVRLSEAKEGRFKPPDAPPSGIDNRAIGEAADNYKALLPHGLPCEPQIFS